MIPDDHVGLIRGFRDYFETGTHIFVHANYDPGLSLERTGGTKLRWDPIEPGVQRRHFSGKTLIVGQTPQVSGEVLNLGFLACIDTDCSRGGWLTALDVGTGRLVQANERGGVREAGPIEGVGGCQPKVDHEDP